MKKFLVLAMMVAFSTGVFASNLWLGGNIGYHNVKDYSISGDSTTAQDFSIAPIIGLDINENWDCGLGLSFNYRDADNYSARTAGVVPFVRHKIFAIGSLDVLAAASVSYSYGNITTDTLADDGIIRSYGINIAPVLKYNICENLKVTCIIDFLQLGYGHSETQYSNGNQTKRDSFGFKANDGDFVTLGFEYHF